MIISHTQHIQVSWLTGLIPRIAVGFCEGCRFRSRPHSVEEQMMTITPPGSRISSSNMITYGDSSDGGDAGGKRGHVLHTNSPL